MFSKAIFETITRIKTRVGKCIFHEKSYRWIFSGIGVFAISIFMNTYLSAKDATSHQSSSVSTKETLLEENFIKHVISESAKAVGLNEELAYMTYVRAMSGSPNGQNGIQNSAFSLWAAERVPSYKVALITAATARERLIKTKGENISSDEILSEAVSLPCDIDYANLSRKDLLDSVRECMENRRKEVGKAEYTLLDVISNLYRDQAQISRDFEAYKKTIKAQ